MGQGKEPEDLVVFLSPLLRIAWMGAAVVALIFLVSVVVTGVFLPVPRRFPDASGAFLYSTSGPGGPLTITAAVCILASLFNWGRHWIAGKDPERPYLFLSKLSLFASGVVALFATLFLWRDASSYTAFGETHAVFRSYRDEAPERLEWSSLHHVEFQCNRGRMRRGGRIIAGFARLYFHFDGGRAIDVMKMTSPGTSKEESLAHLDDLRIRESAPIIWSSKAQQEWFREQDRDVYRCVDRFLARFPGEKRESLLAALNAPPALRDETLATYRRSN